MAHPASSRGSTPSHLGIQAATAVRIRTAVRPHGEMEAPTVVSVAALTTYDMIKRTAKGTTSTDVTLLAKAGGRYGVWHVGSWQSPRHRRQARGEGAAQRRARAAAQRRCLTKR